MLGRVVRRRYASTRSWPPDGCVARCGHRAHASAGRACPSRVAARRPSVAGASRAWLREAGERSRTRAATRPWPPCRGEATRSGWAGVCAGPPGGLPDAWLLRPRGVRELRGVRGLLEARAGAVLPRGRRLRGAAPRRRLRPGGPPHAGAVARRARLVGPAARLPEGLRSQQFVRELRRPGEPGSAWGAARAPRPGGAGPSRCWAAGPARSEAEPRASGWNPWSGGRRWPVRKLLWPWSASGAGPTPVPMGAPRAPGLPRGGRSRSAIGRPPTLRVPARRSSRGAGDELGWVRIRGERPGGPRPRRGCVGRRRGDP